MVPVLYKYCLGEPRLHGADESKKVVKAPSSFCHWAAAAPFPSPPVSAGKHGLGIWVPPLLCEWAICSPSPPSELDFLSGLDFVLRVPSGSPDETLGVCGQDGGREECHIQ